LASLTNHENCGRLNPDGSRDTTFGAEPALGRSVVDFDTRTDGFTGVHLRPDRIIAVGYTFNEKATLAAFDRELAPDLSVAQAAKPKAARPRAKVVFTISLVNVGTAPASGVVLTYQIPPGLVRIAGGGWSKVTARRFTLNVGNLGVGESLTAVFKARVAASARPRTRLRTTVTADLDSLNGPDANLADNVHKISVRVL
jgi:uncharacterized repeat protein (TIGR01451 family)